MMTTERDLLKEFVRDIDAAYGSQGESDEEIFDILACEWPDLAATWRKAKDLFSKNERRA